MQVIVVSYFFSFGFPIKTHSHWSTSHIVDICLDRLVILIVNNLNNFLFHSHLWQNVIDFQFNLPSYLGMPPTIHVIQWSGRFVVLPFVLLFLIGDGLSCNSDRFKSSPLLPGSYRDIINTHCQMKGGNSTQRFKFCQAINNRLFLRPLWAVHLLMVLYFTYMIYCNSK